MRLEEVVLDLRHVSQAQTTWSLVDHVEGHLTGTRPDRRSAGGGTRLKVRETRWESVTPDHGPLPPIHPPLWVFKEAAVL